MRGMLLALVLALVVAGPAAASDQNDVMTVVKQFVDAFNKGDTKAVEVICAEQTSIIDEFPPHEWHGPTACADWWKALNTYNEKNEITDGSATLGTPWNVEVTGDHAYYVAPMTYIYKQHGKSVKESATFAVALKRTQTGWRITAWAYSKQQTI